MNWSDDAFQRFDYYWLSKYETMVVHTQDIRDTLRTSVFLANEKFFEKQEQKEKVVIFFIDDIMVYYNSLYLQPGSRNKHF